MPLKDKIIKDFALLFALTFPIYIPIKVDMLGVNAFVSNVRPEIFIPTGQFNYVNFYFAISFPIQ